MDLNKKILEIYNEISKSQKSILQSIKINEVSSSSEELFGGVNVKIPADGAHAGQSGWHSGNAWDIYGTIGTPVYALADGVAETFADYGKTVRQTDGKKLFGQSFTVKSDNGLPSIYYTHLERSPVQKGSKIQCGQLLGYITDFPDSTYDHVHIGVERGNISQFLNSDGSMKCAKGQKLSGNDLGSAVDSNSNASEDAYNYATGNQKDSFEVSSQFPEYAKVAGSVSSATGLYEQTNFGKNISNRYGRVIIPKDDNPRIKSPLSGKIVSKYSPSCNNQITIENTDNGTTYLQYCGISSPKSLRDGQSIRVGDVLGTTDTDVEVNMYDHKWSRIPISSTDFSSGKQETGKDNVKKPSTETQYFDPFMAALIGAPVKIFQDKFDKQGNRVEKRYGGVADKQQVDPWVLNFLKDPFNRKKVNENIEKIKKML